MPLSVSRCPHVVEAIYLPRTTENMSESDYRSMLAKTDAFEIREELVVAMIDSNVDPDKYEQARKIAAAKVDAMTPAQQKAELEKRNAKALAEVKTAREKHRQQNASSDEDGGGGGGSGAGTAAVVGIAAVLLVLFAIWPILCAIVAMAAAYRTASGSVSG